MKHNARIIAFYLPQYHPTPNNDKWWGKGFTEWTNVGKAKPLYWGHEQPKVPADLGYYDLRLPEVRESQAQLAREAGIEGFCYYHYWFGDGHEELDRIFKDVVRLKQPDFPFCLCWANESWHKKFWNNDGTCEKKLLAEQKYDDINGHIKHFYSLLDAFKDHRYIKVDGKLLFMIYKPLDFPRVKEFMDLWNELAKKNGLKGFHFIGQTMFQSEIEKIKSLNFSSVNIVRFWEAIRVACGKESIRGIINYLTRRILGLPRVVSFAYALKFLKNPTDSAVDIYPTLVPNWDHTPRSGRGGTVLKHSTPKLFKKQVINILSIIKEKPFENQIIFLKSWNEWGEGNYMEPDLKFGKGYIIALKEALDELK